MFSIFWFLIGLSFFLFGIYLLKQGLSLLNNFNLRNIIYRFTNTPLTGCITGTGLTVLLQSSSTVTVVSIGMVDAGIMTFAQALGIVLGTNIGTTVTGQLMAFDLEKWGLPLITTGLIFFIISKLLLSNSTTDQPVIANPGSIPIILIMLLFYVRKRDLYT